MIDADDLTEVLHGVRAVGLGQDVSPEHRSFMDQVVQMLREDRDAT